MKLLVFAHIPPPHHGQSYMVKLMLDGLGGDCRKRQGRRQGGAIECYHVNAQLSESIDEIGTFRLGKLMLLLRYCAEAIWCRLRYGVRTFYYVPAPGKRAALYRDWLVMLFCRPFFRYFIHHWHAVGLGDWLEREGNWLERWITHRLLGRPALGVGLAVNSMRDALWFRSHSVEIIPNGIPDPCPQFESEILPLRKVRLAARRAALAGTGTAPYRVLYLAHALREKGLFDTLEAVALANARLSADGSPLHIYLTVAGSFVHAAEEAEFHERLARPDLARLCRYAGFVDGVQKSELLAESDCLCFPTYYHAESFGLVVIEAMAAGLTVVTTRWRALPEILPPMHPGFAKIHDPQSLADALIASMLLDDAELMRRRFLENYSLAGWAASLERAIVAMAASKDV